LLSVRMSASGPLPMASSPGGSGLGLAIAAEIAAAHGGTAEAARAFPRGLRIRLSLPGYASPRRIRTAAAASSTSA
jgi:signal transduction histidine kinase